MQSIPFRPCKGGSYLGQVVQGDNIKDGSSSGKPALPKHIQDLPTPCFLLDRVRLERNTARMISTCKDINVSLRPHTKTHKTRELAEMSTGGTKRGITVSTLAEAEFYADAGFDDILYAYPITASKISRCVALMQRIKSFHVMISDLSGMECLKAAMDKLPQGAKWSVAIEIDTGYGRTGFLPYPSGRGKSCNLIAACKEISKHMQLLSLYAHCGSSYDAKSAQDREKHHREVVDVMVRCKKCVAQLFPSDTKIVIGIGSTPSCSLPSDCHHELDEFHPGNYVFNDYEQYLLNACRQGDIACRVMTQVIAHKPEKAMILVDCGFLALGHDGMRQRPEDFCLIDGESNLKMIGMTQEIGKVKAKEGDLDCKKYPVGTILYIYPFHSCLTAALHQTYYVHCGDDVVDAWTPVKGW